MPLDLTRHTQELIIAHTLKGHPSAILLLTLVEPSDWDNPNFSAIWSVLQNYYRNYQRMPSKEELVEVLPPEIFSEVMALYTQSSLDDIPLIIDKTLAFIKSKRLSGVLTSVREMILTNPDAAEQLLRKGLAEMPAPMYSTSTLDYLLPDAIYNYNESIYGLPTGISILDHSTRGGVGLGEIFIIAAPSMGGKSTLLSMICATVSRLVPCMYVTLELSKERIAQLLTCKIAHIPQSDLTESLSSTRFVEARKRVLNQYPIELSYYPSNALTVSQIGGMLEYMRTVKNNNIKALFVDYADLLTTTRVPKGTNKWEQISTIYQELVDLAKMFNVAVFTASQLKNNDSIRQGVIAEVEQGDFAGSIEKINKADIAVAWKPIKREQGFSEGILSFPKVRSGVVPPAYYSKMDYNNMTLTTMYPFNPMGAVSTTLGGNNEDIIERTSGGRRSQNRVIQAS